MKIKTKLQLIIIVNLLILAGIISLNRLWQVQDERLMEQEALITQLNLAVFERARLREDYFLRRTPQSREQFLLVHGQIGERLSRMSAIFNEPEDQASLIRMKEAHRRIGAYFSELVGIDDAAGAQSAGQAARQAIISLMLVNAHAIYRDGLVLLKAANQRSGRQNARFRLYGNIGLGMLFLSLLFFAVIVMRSIAHPLKRLQEGTEMIARGNLDYRTAVGTRDEIGRLSRSFDAMAENLRRITVSRDELNGEIERRRQTEEALRALSSRQETLLAAIPDIVMEVDGNKVYTWANQPGRDFFGEDVVGREAAYYFEGEQDTYAMVQPLFRGREEVIYLESWQRRRDGEKRLLAWWCRVLKDPGGEVIGALSSARDITERKRAEAEIRMLNAELERRVVERTAQLEDANRELEAFSYSVSHDLRGPLRAIDGFSRILLEDYGEKLDDEGKRLFNVIRTNTQRMDQLITDLLALSRVSKNELNLSRIDMTAMVRSIIDEVLSPDVQAKFVLNVATLPEAAGDPALLRQVWRNLIANAVKFTLPRPERRIDIEGRREGEMNVYSIGDTGVGFNPKYGHKLFGVFQRLHKIEEFEGNGVGLAIVQRIVHRHGGRIRAEGNINEGAVFTFSLPCEEASHE